MAEPRIESTSLFWRTFSSEEQRHGKCYQDSEAKDELLLTNTLWTVEWWRFSVMRMFKTQKMKGAGEWRG